MMRCCGRISCLRILHLSKLQKRELQRKQLVSAMRFDSLPDNNRTSPDVCFVTNLRLSHHTKLQTAAPHLSISNTGLPAALIGFVKSTGTRTLQRNQMGATGPDRPIPEQPLFLFSRAALYRRHVVAAWQAIKRTCRLHSSVSANRRQAAAYGTRRGA
jgi:hypothetical protein